MSFPHLAGFASFLIHNSLEELVNLNIKRARELNLPILRNFLQLSEKELFEYAKAGLEDFLRELAEGKGKENALLTMKKWQEDQLPDVGKNQFDSKDIALINHTRKHSMLSLLSQYTKDIDIFHKVVLEIEELFAYKMELALHQYSVIMEERIEREAVFNALVMDNVPSGIIGFDRAGNVTVWNKSVENRLGIDKDKVLGKNINSLFSNYKNFLSPELFDRIVRGEKVKIENIPYQHRHGFYDIELLPLKNKTGEVVGGVSISVDITESKLAKEQIQEKNFFLEKLNIQLKKEKGFSKALLLSEVSGIIGLDEKLNYIEWNGTMEKLLGKKAGEVIGKNVLEVFPGTQDSDSVKAFRAALKGETTILLGKQSTTVKGFYYDSYVLPLKEEDDEIRGVVSVILDVTEKRKAEEKLIEREHFLNKVTRLVHSIIAVYDVRASDYSYISSGIASILGYDPKEVISKGVLFFNSLIHPDDRETVVLEKQQCLQHINSSSLKNEDAVHRMEYRIKHKDGKWRWIETFSTTFSRDEKGNVQSLLDISVDISARKRMEEELRAKNQVLEGIIQHLPVIVTKTDSDGFIIESVGSGLDELGMQQNQAAGLHLVDSFPKNKKYTTQIVEGKPVSFVSETENQTGKRYHQNYFFPDQYKKGFIGFSLDITAQKEAENKLIESWRFIEKIAELAPYPIAVVDYKKSLPIYVNYESLRILGYTNEEIIQKRAMDLSKITIHPSDVEKINERNDSIARLKDEDVPELEYRIGDRDGNWIWLSSKVKVFKRDEKGAVEQYISIASNVTERKKQELEIDEKNRELSALLEELKNAEEQLILTNNSLERRVEIRTKELAASEEELKQTLERTIEMNEHIQQREAHLKLLTNSLPVLIAYLDSNLVYQFINDEYLKWFLITEDQIIGKSIPEILGPGFEKLRSKIDLVFSGQRIKFENQHNYKGKGLLTVETHYVPHIDNGKVVGFYSLTYDVTESKKIQQTLEEALDELAKFNNENEKLLEREKLAFAEAERLRKKLHNLFMQTPALLSITEGKEFRYELANPRYLQVFGVEGTIEGKVLADVMKSLDPEIINILHSVMDKGERYIGNELPLNADWDRTGHLYNRYFTLIFEPIKETDGNIRRMITFGYEVTEHVKAREKLKEVNEELLNKNDELLRINNDLDNFIYTASHDLKSPISNMEGLLLSMEKSLKGKLELRELKLLEMMETSIERLKNTITSLTDISKITKNLDEGVESISFKDLIEDIKQDLVETFSEIEIEIKEDLQVKSINFVKPNLRSIVFNLLNNAVKYRSPERDLLITLKTYVDGDCIVFSVQDNGLGVKAEHQNKLFMLFRRLHKHVEGTGVGLFLVKKIVENSGGRIEVESKENEGSVFKVYLPSR